MKVGPKPVPDYPVACFSLARMHEHQVKKAPTIHSMPITRYWKKGGCGCARRRARRQFNQAAADIGPRQCAAMENIDAATPRGDAAMWCWVAAVVLCDAARRGAKAADAAN
ncbi:hypothetical protein DFH06DRAFT_1132381 [Mycena polygramma]|nr:hypothetical protein DFH06DRAFT_1132381 [Mycena polygramma]